MTMQPLPLIDPARTEFGFCRTQCACVECRQSCHHIPGYLVPADLERIYCQVGSREDRLAWVRRHLLASPGAVVMRGGQTFRIPTLVPARRADGACRFLTATGQCAIHAVSPFGCAFFDSHMSQTEADRRSKCGLRAVEHAWATADLYALLWVALAGRGHVALPPEVVRQQQTRQHRRRTW